MPTGIKEWIQQVTDRALEILDLKSDGVPLDDLISQCHAVLSRKGEATGLALAGSVVASWHALDASEHLAFFRSLIEEFGPDRARLDQAIKDYQSSNDESFAMALHQAAEAKRQELFRRMNAAPNGLQTLILMREALRKLLRDHPELKPIDQDLVHLFTSWFNKGFLRLERINWQTPAAVLEKLIQYESVHEIQGWDDLRRRLAEDRLCFAYFHPVIPDEPLIFVEVALVQGMADAIGPLLDTPPAPPISADTAVFYSINNCQPGLAGVSFGNLLIKQVVSVLQAEHPKLRRFVTLSPIPGLRRWLDAEGQEYLSLFETSTDHAELKPVVAKYLTSGQGAKLKDPVARFHLGNGATLERINANADLSSRGQKQSFGFMVNYLYELDDIVSNHEQLMETGQIAASKDVQQLLKKKTTSKLKELPHVS
ncbi:MAG: malonyl-CoA decarboxylase [Gammaproteobacteria bacterium]|jgi:malonyl-CoA decarboxylase